MNWQQKLGFTVILSLMMVGALEIFASFQIKDDIYQGDLGYFWRLKPHLDREIQNELYQFHLRSNALGLRDDEIDSQKEIWLFLGCSTTMGWGIEEEQGFIALLQKQFPNVDVVNGGQPGWSTQQGIHGIALYQDLQPSRVFVGFGVRDAQWSLREDKDAKPQSLLMKTHLLQWLQQLKSPAKTSQKSVSSAISEEKKSLFRVSPNDFAQNLQVIREAFPNAQVQFYEFPQLDFSSEHHQVLLQKEAWMPIAFQSSDFFENDPIHLNETGHQKLTLWFMGLLKQ